jgi:hypothetical protein
MIAVVVDCVDRECGPKRSGTAHRADGIVLG